MTTTIFRVTVDGVDVGLVAHQDCAMIWYEGVEPTWEEARYSDRACSSPPDVVGKEPHRLAWCVVVDRWAPFVHPSCKLLYCPTCRTLIPPPHNGSDYDDYPAAWLALVDEQPKAGGAGEET